MVLGELLYRISEAGVTLRCGDRDGYEGALREYCRAGARVALRIRRGAA